MRHVRRRRSAPRGGLARVTACGAWQRSAIADTSAIEPSAYLASRGHSWGVEQAKRAVKELARGSIAQAAVGRPRCELANNPPCPPNIGSFGESFFIMPASVGIQILPVHLNILTLTYSLLKSSVA